LNHHRICQLAAGHRQFFARSLYFRAVALRVQRRAGLPLHTPMPLREQLFALGKLHPLNVLEATEHLLGKRRIGPPPLQLDNNIPLPANASVAFLNENFHACQFVFEIARHVG
jgi:hypothetical protein